MPDLVVLGGAHFRDPYLSSVETFSGKDNYSIPCSSGLPDLPVQIRGFAFFTLRGAPVICGGIKYEDEDMFPTSECWKFDRKGLEWVEVAPMLSDR